MALCLPAFIFCKSSSCLHSSEYQVMLWSQHLHQIAQLFKESHTSVSTFAQICNPGFLFFRYNIHAPNFPFSSCSHLQTTDLLVCYTKPLKETGLYSLNDSQWINTTHCLFLGLDLFLPPFWFVCFPFNNEVQLLSPCWLLFTFGCPQWQTLPNYASIKLSIWVL